MSDPLDDLKSVHRHEQAAVPGHWTVEHLERGIAEIERLRLAVKDAYDELQKGNSMRADQILRDAHQQTASEK